MTMKKLPLLVVTVGIVLFVSCGEEQTVPPEEKPFPIGSWRTTHQYFDLTVALPEEIKTKRDRETSVDVAEAESCRLTFYEDGSGYGSGILPDGTGRYGFVFKWSALDGKLMIDTASKGSAVFYYCNQVDFIDIDWYGISSAEEIVWKEHSHAVENVEWKTENSATDSMVLSTFVEALHTLSETQIKLLETHTYRYTFEKVE
jgi:hypothetical protein